MDTFTAKETVAKGVDRANQWLSNAVLKEEAIARLGGEKWFLQAVERGAVRMVMRGSSMQPAWVMHAFSYIYFM